MKKLYFHLITLFLLPCNLLLTTSQQTNLQQPQFMLMVPPSPVNVFNNADANAHANPKHYASVNQHQQNQMQVTQVSEHKIVHVHTFDLNLAESFKPLIESYKQNGSSIISWIDTATEHKVKTIACILGTCYCYLYYELYKTNKLLNETTSWCNWKQIVTIQHLTAAKYDDLIQELLTDIQKKYIFISDNKFQTISHDHLIQEIFLEKKALQNYQSTLYWAEKLYISRFLPLSVTAEILTEKLARLDFIINLFSTWQSKQNYNVS